MHVKPLLRWAALVVLTMPGTSSRATFPSHGPRGWWFKVCDKKTESSGLQIKAQLGGNGVRDSAPWTDPITWHRGSPLEFGLPDNRQDLWYARKIHLFARSLEDDKNVYVGLFYNDREVKVMTFDSDGWDEEQEWVRPDDKDGHTDDDWHC